MASNGFVKLRRGILEHAEKGLLPADEFAAFIYITLRADHETGVWIGNALLLARGFRRSWTTGKTWLRNLVRKGYIEAKPSPAQRGSYAIRVLRYRPANRQVELFSEGVPAPSEGGQQPSRGRPGALFEGSRLPPSTQEVESEEKKSADPIAYKGTHLQITDPQHQKLVGAYPGLNVAAHYAEADLWLDANPQKRRKNHYAFARNWLAIAQRHISGNGRQAEALIGMAPAAGVHVKAGYRSRSA